MSLTRAAFVFGAGAFLSAAFAGDTPKHAVPFAQKSLLGVKVRPEAYHDQNYPPPLDEPSRYTLSVIGRPKGYQWELVTRGTEPHGVVAPEEYAVEIREKGVELGGYTSALPYANGQKVVRVQGALRQFDTFQENVTFRNLAVVPRPWGTNNFRGNFRALRVTEPQTVTTPSGIRITLPAQDAKTDAPGFYSGPGDVPFVHLEVRPGAGRVPLPLSPLFVKHGQAVTIDVDAAAPLQTSGRTHDGTERQLNVYLGANNTVTHLDALTLVVTQRADLQTVPFALDAPIAAKRPERVGLERLPDAAR